MRLTVEVNWGISKPEATSPNEVNSTKEPATENEFTLEVTNGRVVEVMDWPPPSSRQGVAPDDAAALEYGSTDLAAILESGQASSRAGACPDRGDT